MAFEIFLSVSALGGGAALMLGPRGEILPLPMSLLERSPFDSYFLPGLVLFTVLGIGPIGAAAMVWFRHRFAPFVALLVGTALLSWLGVQIAIIGYSNTPPLQPFYLLLGGAITIIALRWLADSGHSIRLPRTDSARRP